MNKDVIWIVKTMFAICFEEDSAYTEVHELVYLQTVINGMNTYQRAKQKEMCIQTFIFTCSYQHLGLKILTGKFYIHTCVYTHNSLWRNMCVGVLS
jgi:hypothetical protein